MFSLFSKKLSYNLNILEKLIEVNKFINNLFKYSFNKNILYYKLNFIFYNLKLFLLSGISYFFIVIYSKKFFLFLNFNIHVKNRKYFFYKFNKGFLEMGKNVYFYNIRRKFILLKQFSFFFVKIVFFYGNILVVSTNERNITSFFSKIGIYYKDEWVYGFLTNFIEFFPRLIKFELKIKEEKNFFLTKKNFKLSCFENKIKGLVGMRMLPDFIILWNNQEDLKSSSLIKESYKFNIPVSGIFCFDDDMRFIVFPLLGELNNKKLMFVYRILLLFFYRYGLLKRILINTF